MHFEGIHSDCKEIVNARVWAVKHEQQENSNWYNSQFWLTAALIWIDLNICN